MFLKHIKIISDMMILIEFIYHIIEGTMVVFQVLITLLEPLLHMNHRSSKHLFPWSRSRKHHVKSPFHYEGTWSFL